MIAPVDLLDSAGESGVVLDVGTVIALISLVGVLITAYLSNKGKNAEIKANGLESLNEALQDELERKRTEIERLQARIDRLETENGTLRSIFRGGGSKGVTPSGRE